MAIAGRVAIVPKGDWSADATYKRLDAVTYNNTLYFAKKDVPAGTATSNTEYWSKSIVGGVSAIATKKEAGIVKPADGLTVAEDGTLKVNIDGTTLTMDQVNNVIKLADTLKEKINGAFPAANVVNNQITTETGYALDARQANPNIDGSLAKKVADLNGSLNKTGLLSAINFEHSGEVFDYLNDNQHNIKSVFFTNWVDNENFPKIYGNGLIMTGLDPNFKFIVYTTTEPNLYFAHYVRATDKNVINWHKCTYN